MLDLLDGKELYGKVDSLRAERGWTIYELAKQAGVSRSEEHTSELQSPA